MRVRDGWVDGPARDGGGEIQMESVRERVEEAEHPEAGIEDRGRADMIEGERSSA